MSECETGCLKPSPKMTFQEGKACVSNVSLIVFNLLDTIHYFKMPLFAILVTFLKDSAFIYIY